MKRALASILAVFLMIGMVSCIIVPASAEEVRSGITGSCAWVQEGTVLTISGNGPMEESYTKYGTYTAPWGADITELRIEEGVTTIGEYAFALCEDLVSVTIPDSVIYIGSYAFYYCQSLQSVTLGTGVRTIGESAFSNCPNLNDVYIKDLASWCAIEFENVGNNVASNPLWYADHLYLNGKLIEDLVIPNGVKRIPSYAFSSYAIKSVSIPDSVEEIERYAFDDTAFYNKWINAGESDVLYIDNCLINAIMDLDKDYVVKEGTRVIAEEAFYDCYGLETITLPKSVSFIGLNAFFCCSKLKCIDVAAGNPYFSSADGVLFDKAQKTLIKCPEAKRGTYPVPAGVKTIGDDAFRRCWDLEEVILPEGLLAIGERSFSSIGLDSLILPESVTTIGAAAFEYSGISEITIGSKVQTIGENAFYGCTASYNGALERVYISDIAAWCNIQYGDNDWSHPMYYADELYLNGELVEDVAIPQGVRSIPSYVFGKDLRSVVIPDSVKAIEPNAFRDCSALEEISIGAGVESIGAYAFGGTAYAKDASNWEEGKILYIGNYLVDAEERSFLDDYVVREGTRVIADNAFVRYSIDSITLPESLVTIGSYAFFDSAVGSIQIPRSLKRVGDDAFGWSPIDEVWYAGNVADRKKIDIGEGNENLTKVAWHYADGTQDCFHRYDNNDDAVCNNCGAVRNVFKDIQENTYFYNSVLWAVGENITSGTGNGKFSPDMPCDRGQVVTFLWRAAGCPEPQSLNNPFEDVKKTDYFYKAVLWAVEQGITSGTGAGKFSPNMTCDRSQIVTFLWRAKGKPAPSGTNAFLDVSKNAYYATAVRWAVGAGVTSGTGGGNFSPLMVCTRAQVVTFLYRAYCE